MKSGVLEKDWAGIRGRNSLGSGGVASPHTVLEYRWRRVVKRVDQGLAGKEPAYRYKI